MTGFPSSWIRASALGAGLFAVALAAGDAQAADERRALSARQATGETRSEEFEKAAEAKRLESIRYLKEILGGEDAPQGETRAEMLLRLADLYFQQGRYLYLGEMAAYDKKYDACFNDEACAKTIDQMKPDTTESRKWQDDSIKLYQQILRSYPRYKRADEATFYLATALQDIGRREEAIDAFTSVTKLYPESAMVPSAFVNIGEYYFDTNEAFKALTAYKKATAFKDSPMYGFANYKLAWCYYNVGEYGKSIDTMKAVVALSQQQIASGDKGKIQLQDEALKDLVRFFADAGELDEAYEYFNGLGKKELIRDMLKRLAGMYFEQGKFEQCVQTYRRLISENPTASENPKYQEEIVKSYKKLGNKEETLGEIDRMLKTYGKNSAWRKSNASNPDAIKAADEGIERNLRQVAVEYHGQARKLGTGAEASATYGLAYKAYKVYLEEFPGDTHAYDVRYAFGELTYKIKRFDEAFEQYMMVVKMDPKGQHSRFCAESAIFAADEQIKVEQKAAGVITKKGPPTPEELKNPQPLTVWEQRLVDACKQYATLFKDDKVKNVIYRSGYLLYNKYHFPEAAEQFNLVISQDPKSKEAEQAAHLILDSFKIVEDWQNLKKNSKIYFDQEGLGSTAFKTEVFDIYERSSFKLIEVTLDKDKDKSKAADAFVKFYEEFPTSAVSAQALNNASVYYRETSRVGDSIKTRHILVDDPKFGPKTKYYYEQVAALGFDYEMIAQFGKAAELYEKMFSLYPKQLEAAKKDTPDKVEAMNQNAADAIYSSAVFRRASGDFAQAITDYRAFIATFPADSRMNDVKLAIGKIWEDQQKWPEAAGVYYDFYTRATKDTPSEFVYFSRLQYGKMLEKQGQKAKAMDEWAKSVTEWKKAALPAGAHSTYAAEMLFYLAQPKFEKYAALKIGGSGTTSRKTEDKAIAASLKSKAQAFVEMEKTYGEVIGVGAGEWGLASLVMLGKVYENMADSLKNSGVPFYLDADQRELYKMGLEDRAYPQIEKAVEAYKAALGKSYELTLYNENTAFATRRLGELRPDDFPGLYEQVLKPRYTSSTKRAYDFESEL